MSSEPKRPIVLLAEDSEDDAFFFRWTLHKNGLACHFVHASDGAEALRILKTCAGPDGQRNGYCPDLVFLDLKMPTLTGFEVLRWIHEHPFDPPLEVVVLSGSEHASDVARATDLGANGYYVKPISADDLRARFSAWHAQQAADSKADQIPAHAANTPPRRA